MKFYWGGLFILFFIKRKSKVVNLPKYTTPRNRYYSTDTGGAAQSKSGPQLLPREPLI